MFEQLGFSRRRLQVCRLRVSGKRQIDIARRLGISQPRVSQQLSAAVARHPQLKPLLRTAARRRMYQLA